MHAPEILDGMNKFSKVNQTWLSLGWAFSLAWTEVLILGADQKERSLWGQGWTFTKPQLTFCLAVAVSHAFTLS